MEVNAHVRLESTVIFKDVEFSVNTFFFFEHVQHYYHLEAFNSDSRAPILIGVIFTGDQFYSSEFYR